MIKAGTEVPEFSKSEVQMMWSCQNGIIYHNDKFLYQTSSNPKKRMASLVPGLLPSHNTLQMIREIMLTCTNLHNEMWEHWIKNFMYTKETLLVELYSTLVYTIIIRACKKIHDDHLGLVDFVTGLVDSVFHLPDRQTRVPWV